MLDWLTTNADHIKEVTIVLLGLLTMVEVIIVAAIFKAAFVRHVFKSEFRKKKRNPAQRHGWETIADVRDRHIRALELNSLAYAERDENGAPLTKAPEQAEGPREQTEHSGHAVRARIVSPVGAAMLGFGIVGTVIVVAFWALKS